MNDIVQFKQQGFSLVPQTLTEAMELAKMMAESDLVPKHFKNKPGDVLIAVQMGNEVGLAPMAAIQNIAVINGKPGIYGDAGKAILLAAGCILEEDDIKIIKQTGQARCKITRGNRPPVERTYSIENAKTAGLWGKEGPWRTNPERQMAWRAFWFAARDAASDLLKGLGGAEELADIVERDITPTTTKPPLEVKPERKTLTLPDIEKYTKDKINPDGVVSLFSPKSLIERGEETALNFIDFLSAKYIVPDDVMNVILSWEPKGDQQ